MNNIKYLIKFIETRHLNRMEFANKISLSKSYVSQILSGKRDISIKFKKGFLSAFGFPVEDVQAKIEKEKRILDIIKSSPAGEIKDVVDFYEEKKGSSVEIKEELSFLMKEMDDAQIKDMIYYMADELLTDKQKLLLLKYLHDIVLIKMVRERAEEEQRNIKWDGKDERRKKQVRFNGSDKRKKTHLYI